MLAMKLITGILVFVIMACGNSGNGDKSTDSSEYSNDTSNPMHNTMTYPQNDLNTPSSDSAGKQRDSL